MKSTFTKSAPIIMFSALFGCGEIELDKKTLYSGKTCRIDELYMTRRGVKSDLYMKIIVDCIPESNIASDTVLFETRRPRYYGLRVERVGDRDRLHINYCQYGGEASRYPSFEEVQVRIDGLNSRAGAHQGADIEFVLSQDQTPCSEAAGAPAADLR